MAAENNLCRQPVSLTPVSCLDLYMCRTTWLKQQILQGPGQRAAQRQRSHHCTHSRWTSRSTCRGQSSASETPPNTSFMAFGLRHLAQSESPLGILLPASQGRAADFRRRRTDSLWVRLFLLDLQSRHGSGSLSTRLGEVAGFRVQADPSCLPSKEASSLCHQIPLTGQGGHHNV